jgi:hypothetical protein
MTNRKARRRARKTSLLRDYKVMIATAISDGWADHTMPSPGAIDGWLNDLYEKYPTIPNDKALVEIATMSRKCFLLMADPEAKTITIGSLTGEGVTTIEEQAAALGVPKTTRYPALENAWKVELDPRIKAGWDRGDPLMPSEVKVKHLVAAMIKHSQPKDVSAALTHRAETDPEDYVRLYASAHPEEKTIRVAALMTPEAEAEADAYMADESDGTVEFIPASNIPIDPETLPTLASIQ